MKENKKNKFVYIGVCFLLIAVICFGIFHYATDFWKTRTINNFKVANSEFKSGKKIKLSKDEISLIMLALSIEYADNLKEITLSSKGKTKEEVVSKIVNFQIKMKQDLCELLEISRYSVGEDDSATIKVKELVNKLDQQLKK